MSSKNDPNSNPPTGNNNSSPQGSSSPSTGESPSVTSSINSNNSATLLPVSTRSSATPLQGSLPNGITITKRIIEGATWPANLVLDLGKSNWLEWSCQLGLLVIQQGLKPWLEGSLACPDPLVSPDAHCVWTHNDDALREFMHDHISTADIDHVKFESSGRTTAHDLFVTLRTVHENHGTESQISLLMKALEIRFTCNTPFRDTLAKLRSYIRRISAVGKVKDEDIFTAILLHSFSDPFAPFQLRQAVQNVSDIPNIDFEMVAKCIMAFDQDALTRRQRKLGQLVNPFTASDVPLPNQSGFATLNPRQSGSKPVCSNCKRDNHSTEYCIAPGGKMSGRTVKEARAAFKAALTASSTSPSDPSP